MSSESNLHVNEQRKRHEKRVIETETDVVHYRLRGAPREQTLLKEDGPENQQPKPSKNKNGFLQRLLGSSSSNSKKVVLSASPSANSLPETASQNSMSGDNPCSNGQFEDKHETLEQACGGKLRENTCEEGKNVNGEKSGDICGIK